MKYREMTQNYIFRELECGLSKEETAKLCFKSVSVVTGWDKGKEIPPECKRLMRMAKGRELSACATWDSFKMHHNKLETPTGQMVTPQEILTGLALLEIAAPDDIKTNAKLLKYARAISKLKGL